MVVLYFELSVSLFVLSTLDLKGLWHLNFKGSMNLTIYYFLWPCSE